MLEELNAEVRPGDWVVAAAGSPPGDLLKLWAAAPGTRAHIEFGFSCMGHEIPAGMGIRMAQPDAGEVFVVCGDGTYLMAPGELATLAQERLKLTIVLLVNGGYRSIRALQQATGLAALGTEFAPPEVDYVANARSFGCGAVAAGDAEGLREALRVARAAPGTVVVVCRVDPEATVPASGAYWDLGVAEVSGDAAVTAAAEAARAGRARRRFHGWAGG